ncbi:hypothetical protein BHE74_00024239 [Ensete ventricosum]|nr:hypothetical protein BHE74_00024239 [Ensete ventricosum]RZR93698.1 hypothetical protein BHM03_00022261 [Ensete ventricosum]
MPGTRTRLEVGSGEDRGQQSICRSRGERRGVEDATATAIATTQTQEARSELEPKSVGVPGECQLGGLCGINDDAEEKANADSERSGGARVEK